MVLLDSLYINNSGGKVLLGYLVDKIEESGINCYYLFDIRCEGSYSKIPNERKCFVRASFSNRRSFYFNHRQRFTKILCFGNVPPPLKIDNAKVYTYLHNTLILEIPKYYNYKKKLKVLLQRLYVRYFKKNTNYWIVQSENVRELLMNSLNVNQSNCLVLPFFIEIEKIGSLKRKVSYLYVSTGAEHKNHKRLLKAWEKLFEEGLNPELHLTIPNNFVLLNKEISLLQRKGMNINNHGVLGSLDLSLLFQSTTYVIYPSLTESFGLPLIEGIKLGNKIIAADLPYTYAVIKPSMVFDPYKVNSISEAVTLSMKNQLPDSEIKVKNEIESLINLLR